MKIKIFAICALFIVLKCGAQPGSLDPTFQPGSGANGGIDAIAIQNDGKIIVAGAFSAYNGVSVNNLARLNADGSLDTTFKIGTGTNGIIYAVLIQTDGKIIIAGGYTTYNGFAANNIARLDTDGTFDATYNMGTGANSIISSIYFQSDGKVIMGGNFTTYNGNAISYIGRLNTDGSFDNTWGPGTVPNGSVYSTLVQPDNGQVVIGGAFTYINNVFTPRLRLARIGTTGNIDGGFYPAVSGSVFALAYQSNGQIIFGGSFQTVDNEPRSNLACVNSTGSLIQPFNQGANGNINAFSIENDGSVIIGGQFTTYGGGNFNNLVHTDDGGLQDTLFNWGGTGASAAVRATAIQTNGKILIGGDFTAYNDSSRNHIARLNACVTPPPGPISGSAFVGCPGSLQLYSIDSVAGADYYTWTLPSGWTGSSDSTSILATVSDTGGIITVVAHTSLCGYSLPVTDTIVKVQIPPAEVCLVTVDTFSQYNIVVWDKPAVGSIDSFIVYRESATNVYARIAAIPYDSLNEYDDTAASANPNATFHTYKVSYIDTCGVESALSDYHITIYLQNVVDGNLNWTLYAIQNGTGTVNPVNFYQVYRDNLGNGNFVLIADTISGDHNAFTDVDYAMYSTPKYVLDVSWGISCNLSRSVNTSRSNIKNGEKSLTNGIPDITDNKVAVFPNPASQSVTVETLGTRHLTAMEVINMMGETVARFNNLNLNGPGAIKQFDITGYAKGVYTLQLETDTGVTYKKLVIQ